MKKRTGVVLAVLSVLFFIVCMGWGVLLSAPELKELHIQLMKVAYPGFAFSATGVVIGLVEAVVYGWVIGTLYDGLCNVFQRKR